MATETGIKDGRTALSGTAAARKNDSAFRLHRSMATAAPFSGTIR
ncbi:hypothetical protein [Actinomadura bangladeshensis]|nr:hypothetical protein [Actinomadura bangladeshensis]